MKGCQKVNSRHTVDYMLFVIVTYVLFAIGKIVAKLC